MEQTTMSAPLRLVDRRAVNRSVPIIRAANAELRTREYLTAAEVEKLIKAARDGRYGHRRVRCIGALARTQMLPVC
jgi:hypothetical protein